MENFFESILETIKKKSRLRRLLTLIIALFVLALVYNLLLLPTELVAGGVNGIAVITNYVYQIDSSLMIFLLSLSCLLFSWMYLGTERTTGSILATFLYPLFVKLTSFLTQNVTINYDDTFLIIIFAGVIGGLANGFIYKTGYSTKSNMVINTIIILIGSVFFGWSMMMYAIILVFINNLMIDKVLLGISNNKAFYIVTSKEKEIREYIVNKLHHTITVFNVKGAFFEKTKKVLLLVVPTRDYYKVTEGIKLIDPKVFFVVEDAYEVKGGK